MYIVETWRNRTHSVLECDTERADLLPESGDTDNNISIKCSKNNYYQVFDQNKTCSLTSAKMDTIAAFYVTNV